MAAGLHLETVEAGTLDLLRRLMADKALAAFNLVGGTALSLQLGHRKSVDLDLFSTRVFKADVLAEHLKERHGADIRRQTDVAVYGFISDVKVDLIHDPDPLIDKVELIDGIRMPSLRDIGALKLSAIYDSGRRLKDFVDIYKLLEQHPLQAYLDYARQKFPDIYPAILKHSLLYHADLNLKTKIEYLGKKLEWPQIDSRLREAYYNPAKVFGANDLKPDYRVRKAPRPRKGPRPG